MSMFAETILPPRESGGLRRWGLAALIVIAAHVALIVALIYVRQSEMPPGNPPDTVMINLAPIAVAPPPQEEVETPPQPQQVQPQTPPQPTVQPQQTQAPVAPDMVEAPQPEVMMAPPPPPKPVQHEAKRKPQHARPRTNLPHSVKNAAPTPGFSGEAAESWRSEIVEKISSVKEYPEAARPASGTAIVAFSVNRSGEILGARLVRSSGSSLLDRAAVETVRRANPVPPPPAGVPGGSFTIPLHFSG
jgi:periplasmic protein TonB